MGFWDVRRAFQTVTQFPDVSVPLQGRFSAQYAFISSCSVVSKTESIGYYKGRAINPRSGLDWVIIEGISQLSTKPSHPAVFL